MRRIDLKEYLKSMKLLLVFDALIKGEIIKGENNQVKQ